MTTELERAQRGERPGVVGLEAVGLAERRIGGRVQARVQGLPDQLQARLAERELRLRV